MNDSIFESYRLHYYRLTVRCKTDEVNKLILRQTNLNAQTADFVKLEVRAKSRAYNEI